MQYAFVNSELLPVSKAVLPINDVATLRGYGVFDFFLVKNGVPLFFDDHWQRLQHSAAEMNLKVPFTRNVALSMLEMLYQKMPYELAGARITITGGCSPDGYLPGEEPNSLFTLNPFNSFPAEPAPQGIGLMTVNYKRPFSLIKTIDYSMGIMMLPQAKAKGFQDILFVHDGCVSECPRSNIFAVTPNDVLITPADGILEGVTRKRVLRHARGIMKVEERTIQLQELLTAKEVFITSSTKGIWPVTNINGVCIGDGLAGKVSLNLYGILLQEITT